MIFEIIRHPTTEVVGFKFIDTTVYWDHPFWGFVTTKIFNRNPIHTLFSGLTPPACPSDRVIRAGMTQSGRLSPLSRPDSYREGGNQKGGESAIPNYIITSRT